MEVPARPMSDFHNMYIRPWMAEFAGTLMFVFLVSLSAYPSPLFSFSYPIMSGLSLFVAQSCFAEISGAHLNPVLSVSRFVHGQLDGVVAVGFVTAQLFGAFLGTVLYRAMVSGVVYEDSFVANQIMTTAGIQRVTRLQAFLLESILSSLLCSVHHQWCSEYEEGEGSSITIPSTWSVLTYVSLPLIGQANNVVITISQSLVYYIFTGDASHTSFLYLNILSAVLAIFFSSVVTMVKRPAKPESSASTAQEPHVYVETAAK